MRLLQTLLLITVMLQSISARCRRPRPNMGIPNMILPGNAERSMQMVKMATQRLISNTCGNPMPVQYSPPVLPEVPVANLPPITKINQLPVANPLMPCSLPQLPNQLPSLLPVHLQNSLSVQLPNPTSIQLPNPPSIQLPIPTQFSPSNPTQVSPPSPTQFQLPIPTQCQLPGPTQYQPPPLPQFQVQCPTKLQLPTPTQIPLQNPTQILNPPIQMSSLPMSSPKMPEIIFENPAPMPCPCQREITYPSSEVTPNLFNLPFASEPVPLTPNQEIYGCPIPSPSDLFNPMLPAASPVSSWTQENLPTTVSVTRSQYLRKVPIPPPTL